MRIGLSSGAGGEASERKVGELLITLAGHLQWFGNSGPVFMF